MRRDQDPPPTNPHAQNLYYPPYPGQQAPDPRSPRPPGYNEYMYGSAYSPYKSEREQQLEYRLAQTEGRARVLEHQLRLVQRELVESQRRIYQWRLNIRNSAIGTLSTIIVVWTIVSVLARYPVLPWNMPSEIIHLITQ